jgi:hypothetical protein
MSDHYYRPGDPLCNSISLTDLENSLRAPACSTTTRIATLSPTAGTDWWSSRLLG